MTPEYLKKLLPQLLGAPLAGMTNRRLVSLAAVYAAVYNMVSFFSLDAEYGDRKIYLRKIDTLFRILFDRCGKESDTVLRCRMIRAMFDLVCGTVPAVDSEKKNACCFAAGALVRNHLKTGGSLLEQAAVCGCITDLLYPEPDPGDEYFRYFQARMVEWAGALSPEGRWPGVPADVSLERIGVLNRNSYLFSDKSCDRQIRQAFGYYRNSVRIPAGPDKFDAGLLPVLGRLYETAFQGNAYAIDKSTAHKIAAFMYLFSQSSIDRNDSWFYCIACVVHHLCEETAGRMYNSVLNTA